MNNRIEKLRTIQYAIYLLMLVLTALPLSQFSQYEIYIPVYIQKYTEYTYCVHTDSTQYCQYWLTYRPGKDRSDWSFLQIQQTAIRLMPGTEHNAQVQCTAE